LRKKSHHLPLLSTRFIDGPETFSDRLQRRANSIKSCSPQIVVEKNRTDNVIQ